MIGPWETEPDKLDWEAHGFPCVLRRGGTEAWCGYVGVPVTHPLHGIHYNQPSLKLRSMLEQRLREPIGQSPSLGVMCAVAFGVELKASPEIVFRVHGGITWSDNRHGHGDPGNLWWFGFDCSHHGDLSPTLAAKGFVAPTDEYRSMDFAKHEAERLAEQLAAIASEVKVQEEMVNASILVPQLEARISELEQRLEAVEIRRYDAEERCDNLRSDVLRWRDEIGKAQDRLRNHDCLGALRILGHVWSELHSESATASPSSGRE
jgi:hypothetical protein